MSPYYVIKCSRNNVPTKRFSQKSSSLLSWSQGNNNASPIKMLTAKMQLKLILYIMMEARRLYGHGSPHPHISQSTKPKKVNSSFVEFKVRVEYLIGFEEPRLKCHFEFYNLLQFVCIWDKTDLIAYFIQGMYNNSNSSFFEEIDERFWY